MTKQIKLLIIVAVLLALAFVLNPSADKHRTVIKETIAERSKVQQVLGVGELTAFVSTYHTFWVGSYTTVNDKVQSVGVFGMVFVGE